MKGKQRFDGPFIWRIITVGGVVCLASVYNLSRVSLARLDISFLVMALITAAIGSRAAVKIPRLSGQITVSDTFIFLTMLLYGGEAAILLAILDGACSTVGISRKARTFLFNSAVMACSTHDHVHMLIEYPPKAALSDLVKRLKGRTSRRLQEEFPQLRKQYWGRHFWAVGYGAWSTGNITEEVVKKYLEHHRHPSNREADDFITG